MGSENSKSESKDRFIEEAREVIDLVDTLSNLLTNDKPRSHNSGRAAGDKYNCPTCSQRLGTPIYQCKTGHGSCQACWQFNRSCGKCGAPLTNTRQPQTSRQQGPGHTAYPQHTQNTTQGAQSHPTLERTRSPYNLTNQELYGAKKENSPNTLYPNLNINRPSTPVQKVQSPVTPVNVNVNYSRPANTVGGRSDTGGFVVVDINQASARPKPSAPPASELAVNEPSVTTTRTPVRLHNVTPAACTSANTNNTGQISRGPAADDKYNCPTCSQRLGTTIYQCKTGHGSCQACKQNNRSCGKCRAPLTNTRNIMLEGFVAENLLVTKTPCPNVGCKLRLNDLAMQNHLNECPFGETECPMGKIFGQCSCRYKIDNLIPHFDVYHKEQLSANVGKEMYIFNICMETQKVFLVKIGPYHFLVHVKVSDVDRKIYMAVQLFGPANSAFKWTYEIHVFNKRQPRRKFQYTDNCLSVSTPIHDIFKESKCAVLPLTYAMTFVNESALTYKFYIKKTEGNWKGRNRGKANNQKNE